MIVLERFFDEKNDKIRELVRKFRGYAVNIDAESMRNWIRQFGEEDWDLAIRLLDWANYYDIVRIGRELQSLHDQIKTIAGFNMDNSYFAPFCRVGHSGEIIVERYRFANDLKRSRFDERFIHLSELNLLYDKKDATLFFLEDFIGTGDATFKIWKRISDIHQENLFLLVIVGHKEGIDRIESGLPLKVVCNRVIYEDEEMFSDSNVAFSGEEKQKIREYCEKAGSYPTGYKDCQSNVVFYYRAPNDVISILRCNNPRWKGLFIRNL